MFPEPTLLPCKLSEKGTQLLNLFSWFLVFYASAPSHRPDAMWLLRYIWLALEGSSPPPTTKTLQCYLFKSQLQDTPAPSGYSGCVDFRALLKFDRGQAGANLGDQVTQNHDSTTCEAASAWSVNSINDTKVKSSSQSSQVNQDMLVFTRSAHVDVHGAAHSRCSFEA